MPVVFGLADRVVNAAPLRFVLRVAAVAAVTACAATTVDVVPATAATPFDGIVVTAQLITVDTSTDSATVRIEPNPSGSFNRDDSNILTRNVVLYTNTTTGSLGHNYRAGSFMDPFEATVPLEGNTSTYPFYHLRVGVAALAATAGGVGSGKPIAVELHVSSKVAGYRVSSQNVMREGAQVAVVLRVDPSWASVAFATFMMVVMWVLALGALTVAVNLVIRRRKFEGAFAAFLATLLFAFPTVRNNLPGIPPVGVLFDYAAFFWAEALVAIALITLITGWTLRALVGTVEKRD